MHSFQLIDYLEKNLLDMIKKKLDKIINALNVKNWNNMMSELQYESIMETDPKNFINKGAQKMISKGFQKDSKFVIKYHAKISNCTKTSCVDK